MLMSVKNKNINGLPLVATFQISKVRYLISVLDDHSGGVLDDNVNNTKMKFFVKFFGKGGSKHELVYNVPPEESSSHIQNCHEHSH